MEWLEDETERLRADLELQHDMIGQSQPMQDVYQLISRVTQTDATVLIDGESGTGKELAARAIHQNSSRSSYPFVAINCAAISETLLESELFGHEKGSFTGAIAQKKGKLEIADKGTLFLDEVGDLAPQLQTKILRFLQEKEFERVGGTQPIKVDIRLIAATNRDLEGAIKDGQFREDLYYRLNVVSLSMPPLRTRRDDIALLTQSFISRLNGRGGRVVKGISKEALRLLQEHDWPGNVRELRNVIERAMVLGTEERIVPEDFPETIMGSPQSPPSPSEFHAAVRHAKQELILKAISSANGNVTEAARLLALQPTYLHRLIRNLDLRQEIKKRLGG
jgi:Nif-specific regulatory protein